MNSFKNIIRNNLAGSAIILYIIVFMLVQYANPSFLYNPDGSLREFGVGYSSKTVLPIWLIAIILGILLVFSSVLRVETGSAHYVMILASVIFAYILAIYYQMLNTYRERSDATRRDVHDVIVSTFPFSSCSFFFATSCVSFSTCARIFCCSGVNVHPIFSR